jgi:hypothetical protein
MPILALTLDEDKKMLGNPFISNDPFKNINVFEEQNGSDSFERSAHLFASSQIFPSQHDDNVINVLVNVTLTANAVELDDDEKTLLKIALRSELQLLGTTIRHLEITDTRIDFTAQLPPHLSIEKLIRNSETKLQTIWLIEKRQSLLFDTACVSSVAIN